MGECDIEAIGESSILKFTCETATLVRMLPNANKLKLFIIRVKRELKRVYINTCRYNERLNAETEGSKTTHIHWVALVNIQ